MNYKEYDRQKNREYAKKWYYKHKQKVKRIFRITHIPTGKTFVGASTSPLGKILTGYLWKSRSKTEKALRGALRPSQVSKLERFMADNPNRREWIIEYLDGYMTKKEAIEDLKPDLNADYTNFLDNFGDKG